MQKTKNDELLKHSWNKNVFAAPQTPLYIDFISVRTCILVAQSIIH